jgi:hypothetical protein
VAVIVIVVVIAAFAAAAGSAQVDRERRPTAVSILSLRKSAVRHRPNRHARARHRTAGSKK